MCKALAIGIFSAVDIQMIGISRSDNGDMGPELVKRAVILICLGNRDTAFI